jgi:signal peptidase II
LKFTLLLLVFIAGLAADYSTKQVAMSQYKNNAPRIIIDGFLEFSYVENRGMIFGVMNNQNTGFKRWGLTGLTLISLVIILSIVWRIRELPFFYHLPFSLILVGAIGNLIDRLRYGFVVDFIHMHWKDVLDYPWLYNIADACIVVGVIVLTIIMLFKNDQFEKHLQSAKQEKTASDEN